MLATTFIIAQKDKVHLIHGLKTLNKQKRISTYKKKQKIQQFLQQHLPKRIRFFLKEKSKMG